MPSFEEWLLRLRDFDMDRYEQIRAMLTLEEQAKCLSHSSMEDARCEHQQITNMACDLCGMDFS